MVIAACCDDFCQKKRIHACRNALRHAAIQISQSAFDQRRTGLERLSFQSIEEIHGVEEAARKLIGYFPLADGENGRSQRSRADDKLMCAAGRLQGNNDQRRFQRNRCERADRHAMPFAFVCSAQYGHPRSPGAHCCAQCFSVNCHAVCLHNHFILLVAKGGVKAKSNRAYGQK